jgi:hypothetical protein
LGGRWLGFGFGIRFGIRFRGSVLEQESRHQDDGFIVIPTLLPRESEHSLAETTIAFEHDEGKLPAFFRVHRAPSKLPLFYREGLELLVDSPAQLVELNALGRRLPNIDGQLFERLFEFDRVRRENVSRFAGISLHRVFVGSSFAVCLTHRRPQFGLRQGGRHHAQAESETDGPMP